LGLWRNVSTMAPTMATSRTKPNVKRQNIAEQVARTKATAIEIVKVQSGQGVS
jgi:NADH-quinone oxidoreductase subunit J